MGTRAGLEYPEGNPGALSAAGQRLSDLASRVDRASAAVAEGTKVPGWEGHRYGVFTAAGNALAHALQPGAPALRRACTDLNDLATQLRDAQRRIEDWAEEIEEAEKRFKAAGAALHGLLFSNPLGPLSGTSSPAPAALGPAQARFQRAASELEELRARYEPKARQLCAQVRQADGRTAGSLNAATAAAPAAASVPSVTGLVMAEVGAGGEDNHLILTPLMTRRAQAAVKRLGASDRQRLDELLANAKSPWEQAYILKALGAGYKMPQVSRFDGMIHEHGDDPAWLKDRLSPLDNTDYSSDDAGAHHSEPKSHGRVWTQGQYPTCVASSNVMARVNVDPLYALWLTTGGHPGDPAHDNPSSFARRLREEQDRVYDAGRPDDNAPDGMTSEESENIANRNIAAHTGVRYEEHSLENNADRRSALIRAERAVDQGIPVPFNTKDHEMLIVGHDGHMVQIYNPWGYTAWMSEEDFVNGNLSAVEQDSGATDIRLPK